MIHHRLLGLFFITFFDIPLNYVQHYVLTDLGQWLFQESGMWSQIVTLVFGEGMPFQQELWNDLPLQKLCVSQFLDVLVLETMKSSPLCSIPTPTKTRFLYLQNN